MYSNGRNVFVDLNPQYYIEYPTSEELLKAIDVHPKPTTIHVRKTHEYNVAVFLELVYTVRPASIQLNSHSYGVEIPPNLPLTVAQLCLVFKNEWDRIPLVIEYYRKVHGIQRFILYDNQSDSPPPTAVLSLPGVFYQRWDIPYTHTIKDKALIHKDYKGPEKLIIAQNSAYSHCLKFYTQALWTVILDTDEFLVRPPQSPSLNQILAEVPANIQSVMFRGYWAGCNSLSPSDLYTNLQSITHRSKDFCKNKLALRTSYHYFTNCIHNPYFKSLDEIFFLSNEIGYYFFHLYTASTKGRVCSCEKYCCYEDRSLRETVLKFLL